MAKKNNNNSDWMSRKQDEQTEQLEERLTALYANAENEIRAKWDDFMSGFEKEDTARRKLVESGSMPEDEYTAWRKTQILKSNQYSKAVESMSNMLVETDVAAMATVNEQLPQVVAESYDFVQGLGFQAAEEAGLTSGTFQIYNARTVQALIKDNPDLMPKPSVDIPEDQRWSKERINREITQGIVQGESIPKIANRLRQVTTMDRNAAVRNARTAMTGAENLGRYQSAQDLRENGIPIEEVWMATPDDRTRESHRLLDGTTRDESGYFGVGIIDTPLRFAGDPLGAPEEVYNCRCRTGIVLQGIDHSQDGDLYAEFMKQFEDGKEMIDGKEPEAQSQHPELEQKTAEEIAEAQAEAFSKAEKTEIMEYYISEEGFAMNAYARGDSLEPWKGMDFTEKDIAEYTDKFTQILENERLEKATQVYRGATFETITQSTGLTEQQIREDPQLLIGQTITEHGFMSTTSQYSMAEEYAGGNVVMRIDLPEGAKAIDENQYLSYLDGKEITVQRECDMVINMAYTTEDEHGREIIIVQAEYKDAGLNKEENDLEQIATSRIEELPTNKVGNETTEEQEYRGHITTETEWYEEHRGEATLTEEGIERLASDLGIDKETAETLGNSVLAYSESGTYEEIRAASKGEDTDKEYKEMADSIETFIDISPKWEGGEISRGMLLNNAIAEDMIQKAKTGQPIDIQGISSWTSKRSIAESFASPFMTNKTNKQSIIFVNESERTDLGTSVKHLSVNTREDEVLVSSRAEFQPTRMEETPDAIIIYGELKKKG